MHAENSIAKYFFPAANSVESATHFSMDREITSSDYEILSTRCRGIK